VPRRSSRAERGRIQEILSRLGSEFPDADCALAHENPFQLLVATILSAQCTDERVNKVTPDLFLKYPDPPAMANADEAELQEAIRSTGFFRNKAKNLKGAARAIVEKFKGRVPDTMEELLELPGVARKTANVVLGTWFGIADGIVVDTHVSRLSQRLGFTAHSNPSRIEKDLMAKVPKEEWIAVSHELILHGRKTCKAQKPRCESCFLADLCPYYADQKSK